MPIDFEPEAPQIDFEPIQIDFTPEAVAGDAPRVAQMADATRHTVGVVGRAIAATDMALENAPVTVDTFAYDEFGRPTDPRGRPPEQLNPAWEGTRLSSTTGGEMLTRPLVTLPEIDFGILGPSQANAPAAVKVAAGAYNAAKGVPEFATSLLGGATLLAGGMPALVQRLVAAGYAIDLARHTPEQVVALAKAIDGGNPQEISETATSLGIGVGLAGLTAKHAISPKLPEVAPLTAEAVAKVPATPAPISESSTPLTTAALESVKGPVRETPAPTPAAAAGESGPVSPVTAGETPPAKVEVTQSTEVAKLESERPLTTPEIIGMGGAVPSEFLPARQTATGIKNAAVDSERRSRGQEPILAPQRLANPVVWDSAMARIDREPGWQDRLIEEMKDKPRTPSAEEVVALDHRYVDLQNEYAKATRDGEQHFKDGFADGVQEARERTEYFEGRLAELEQVARNVGTEWGRSGQMSQRLMREDFSLAAMEAKVRASKGFEPLTEAEHAEISDLHTKLAEAERKATETEAANNERVAQLEAEKAMAEARAASAASRTTKGKIKRVATDIAGERKNITDGLAEAVNEGASTPDIGKYARALAENFIKEGVREIEPLTDAVHGVLKGILPDITRTESRDAWTQYGKYKQLNQDPVKVRLRELSTEGQKLSTIERLENKQPGLKTGVERQPPTDAARRLQKRINELKKELGIVTTDPATQLRSALEAIKTRNKNRIADLRFENSTRTRIVRNKRVPPSDAEVVAQRAEIERLKKENEEIFGQKELTDEQRLARAISAAERAETAANERLSRADKGDFKQAEGRPLPDSATLDEVRARTAALRMETEHLKSIDAAFQEQKRLASQTKQLADIDQRIEEAARQINEGEIEARKSSKPVLPELAAKRGELADLNKVKQQLRNALKPKRSAEEIAIQSLKTRMATEKADLTERLAGGDFSPRRAPAKDLPLDPETAAAKAEVAQLREEFQKQLERHKYELKSRGEKIWHGIKKTTGAFVNIASSFDFSAPRQALVAILANTTRLITSPFRGAMMLARPFGQMFRAWASEKTAGALEQQRKHRANATSGADKIAEVHFAELHTSKFTRYEENAHSILDDWATLPFRTGNLAKTVTTAPAKAFAKGVRASNRAFITFLNSTRAELFDELLRVNYEGKAPSANELKIIGNYVNVATGRGKIDGKTASVASSVIWAPYLLASRVQIAVGQPLWTGQWAASAKARTIVAKEYARAIMSGFLLWQVSRLFDEKDEARPTSSDFGKIVRGNTRIDLWGGLQQVTTLGARTATASTTSLKGKESDIGAAKKYGQRGIWHVWADFGRSKLRPDVATAVDVLTRTDFIGRPTTAGHVAKSLLVPLPMRDIVGVMREHGFTEGMIVEALGQFGAGISRIEEREGQK